MSEEALTNEVHALRSLLEQMKPGSVCPMHNDLAKKIDTMVSTLASIPAQFDGLSKEFKYVGAEMDRRTKVLFDLIPGLQDRLKELEKQNVKFDEIIKSVIEKQQAFMAEHQQANREGHKQSEKFEGRLRFLEDWRIKIAGQVALILVLVQFGIQVWGLFHAK